MSVVLFCGTLKGSERSSWDKTNDHFFRALAERSTCTHIDYSIKNAFARKGIHILTQLIYGETIVRDPVHDLFLERNFRRFFDNQELKPDLVVHSSGVCVPAGYEHKAVHVMYTDASIMGAIKYNGFQPGVRAMRLFTKETMKYSGRLKFIFTFNEWTMQSLIRDFGVDPRKVVNVGFGANLKPYFGEKNYSNNEILIVLRRGLEKNKGLYLLLEAFKIAYRQEPSIRLSVVGTTLEPVEGVKYFDGNPREKTIELFQKASLYAMPALFEPNGMVYIEALACKTPVLGLDRLAFPEFSGYGKYGFIVQENAESVADTLLKSLRDPEKLEKMGKEGQDYVLERFNWDIVTNKILGSALQN